MPLKSDIEELTRICQRDREEARRRRREREILIQSTIAGGVASLLGSLALTAIFHLCDGDTKKQPVPAQVQVQPKPH